MWRSKKFILIAALAALLLVGSIGGIALANDDGDGELPGTRYQALLDRVCEIYEDNTDVAIDSEALEEAFAQAQDELRAEAMEGRLDKLVEEGKLTQGEADELQDWLEARPDIGDGFDRGFRAFPARGRMWGLGGSCTPIE